MCLVKCQDVNYPQEKDGGEQTNPEAYSDLHIWDHFYCVINQELSSKKKKTQNIFEIPQISYFKTPSTQEESLLKKKIGS